MDKLATAIALAALTLALAAPANAASGGTGSTAASRNGSASSSASPSQDQNPSASQPGVAASKGTKAVLGHTWDDQTEETAKMPGTTGPLKTPKGGAGLSYPSTE